MNRQTVWSLWRGLIAGRLVLAALGLWLAPGLAAAEPMARLVPADSKIIFVSKQMGVPVEGVFKQFDAQVAFDPKKPEGGSIVLHIDTGSAAIGAAQSDAELPKAPWFDVARFPQATFQSQSLKGLGGGRFEVAGKLTLKGNSRYLVVPVTITQTDGTSVASGTFALKRLEFRVGDGDWTDTSLVADEVQIRFKLTLTGLGPL